MKKSRKEEPAKEGFFSDEMHRELYIFPNGLKRTYVTIGGKITDPVKVKPQGRIVKKYKIW